MHDIVYLAELRLFEAFIVERKKFSPKLIFNFVRGGVSKRRVTTFLLRMSESFESFCFSVENNERELGSSLTPKNNKLQLSFDPEEEKIIQLYDIEISLRKCLRVNFPLSWKLDAWT